jgi:hypothetical protein
MVEGTEENTTERPKSWEPTVDTYEWYSRFAAETMEPCDDCSAEYKTTYAKLKATVDVADYCFKQAYGLYSELSNRSHEQKEHEPRYNTD